MERNQLERASIYKLLVFCFKPFWLGFHVNIYTQVLLFLALRVPVQPTIQSWSTMRHSI